MESDSRSPPARELMRRLFFAFLLAALLAMVGGCSTMADAKAAKGTGTVRVYERPYDVVWQAVLATVQDAGLRVASESKGDGLVLAEGGVGLFTWGENVAVYVQDAGGRVRTRVEIINKRVLATNLTAYDWEGRLSRALDQRLAQ